MQINFNDLSCHRYRSIFHFYLFRRVQLCGSGFRIVGATSHDEKEIDSAVVLLRTLQCSYILFVSYYFTFMVNIRCKDTKNE